MSAKSTISAYGAILTSFKFPEPESKSERFAIQRYLKKMEAPNDLKANERKEACFNEFIEFDRRLPGRKLLRGNWYRSRVLMHSALSDFRLAPVAFTNGSEVTPTRGFNSIESKLMRSAWDCTIDCWDLWADLAYETLAIKRAARRRFERFMSHDRLSIKSFHKSSWELSVGQKDRKAFCFKRMLSRITNVVEGSRFSTVRKNNEKDRPIDLQPLCNMLVQRTIGNGIRNVLLEHFGVDLDTLAEKHGSLISDLSKATIDLKNASDSISLQLCEFLLPKKFFSLISRSRTYMTYGLDGHYHVLNKVSSMGNGFTFELMSLLLMCIGQQHDRSFSVFGDDIIIDASCALEFISDLEDVGFVVNKEKSFLTGDFRESCGFNYFADEGYVKSFDFQFPHSLSDCITLHNKCYVLAQVYPSFKLLLNLLVRPVPKSLQGPFHGRLDTIGLNGRGWNKDLELSSHFWSRKVPIVKVDDSLDSTLTRYLKDSLHIVGVPRYFYGLQFCPSVASSRRTTLKMKSATGKYMMYLSAGRSIDDVVTGSGSWQEVLYVSIDQRTFRVKSLLKSISDVN